jgi:alpha-tubulin suppressor-like RCC1 family protein
VPVPIASGLRFSVVSAGSGHTCALDLAGSAFCWGSSGGLLGNGLTAQSNAPVAVIGGLAFATISASPGENFTCAVAKTGAAYCWGHNEHGQFGNGTSKPSFTPIAVGTAVSFRAISTGDLHTCGLDQEGEAYCWGDGRWGQLGIGTSKYQPVPTAVHGGLKFTELSAGGLHTCAITLDGRLYCWGALGKGNTLVPKEVPFPSSGSE